MRIRLAIPDELDDQDRKEALDAALESVTRTVAGMVRKGIAPPAAGQIKARRVRWHPEPPGDEHFDLPTTVIARGHGDCDDLAPWHAGSLRAGGVDPGARAIVRRSGPKRWHAIVRRSDGSIEDPSAAAGMHSVGGGMCGAGPAITNPMSADGHLCVAICPTKDRRHPLVWFARCDVPDSLEPWDWSTTAAHTDPSRALVHAVKTARAVAGDAMDEEDYLRLGALQDLVMGADPERVADVLAGLVDDEELLGEILGDAVHSVGFFGGVLKGLKSVANAPFKIAKKGFGAGRKVLLAPFQIPGVSQLTRAGLPMAATYFGGAPAGMAASQLSPYIVPRGTDLPGYAGQALDMLPGLAQAASSGQFDPQMLAQAFPGLAKYLQQIPGATHTSERGVMAAPWGALGPSVMRF